MHRTNRPAARRVLPEFTESAGYGSRALDPYSRLFEERIVLLGTPIDDAVANDVMAQLLHLEHSAPGRDISLYINSPGGSFTAMTAIHDTMRFIGCDIETVCLGQASSAAAVLLAAGTPGKRLALPGARVMIHQPSLAEPVRGQVRDLEIQSQEMLRTRRKLEELLAEHTGQPLERVRRDIERDLFLDAGAAVAYGLVDRLTADRKASRAARAAG
ncbi:ATP-dependent Clp protease proteolytic subunit [Streptomyces carminius]|uniref:ATP-dependent Clp protease proteolytic subunit n=1 Tax=Streptomyces carminius TaxID=2665496 RepID=A0A2M8M168_9ACTN|nr:ATP-dependent Clp protease proteolytic subunit [Streptomyces carminius]PJE97953.1 ATP-dependent Clp protease proteolytic subunit [Streptomyces carminius]PJF01780.1 ATP-dependent Clp protease proteolytic subunit [Streptomyces carminius]